MAQRFCLKTIGRFAFAAATLLLATNTGRAQTLVVNIGGDGEISQSEVRTIAARLDAGGLLYFDRDRDSPGRFRAACVSIIIDRADSGVRNVLCRLVLPLGGHMRIYQISLADGVIGWEVPNDITPSRTDWITDSLGNSGRFYSSNAAWVVLN